MSRKLVALAAILAALLPPLARAQAPAAAPAGAPALSALKAEYLAEVAGVEKKIRALAEAIPEEKYGWRPAQGVRSVAEVFAHIAGGNYFLASLTGVATPADVPKDLEQLTKKSEIPGPSPTCAPRSRRRRPSRWRRRSTSSAPRRPAAACTSRPTAT